MYRCADAWLSFTPDSIGILLQPLLMLQNMFLLDDTRYVCLYVCVCVFFMLPENVWGLPDAR